MGTDTYEDRAVAFIDILGFKNLVRDGRVSTILNAMEIMKRRIQEIEGVREAQVNISQFSDSLILSAPNNQDGLPYLVHFASLVASELFLNGIWCRGGITTGPMYHKGSVAFGQALIDAYDLESKLAVCPRILITWGTADRFVKFRNDGQPRHKLRSRGNFFRQDFDQNLHLDIFSPMMSLPQSTGTIKETTVKTVHGHIMEQIDASEKIDVMQSQSKLFWISNYLSYVEECHGAWHVTVPEQPAK
jgi:hypothetical protein